MDLLFKAPETPCSTLVPCGSMFGGASPPKEHAGGCPGLACLVGPGPVHLGLLCLVDNGPFYVSSEEAKQNNPALAPSSPSCPPPPFAVRGFPALSVTPGQLEGHQARGVRPWPEAGLWGQLRQALRAGGPQGPGRWTALVNGCGSCWAALMAKAWSLPSSSQGSWQCLLWTPHLLTWGWEPKRCEQILAVWGRGGNTA